MEYTPNGHSLLIWAARIKPKKGHYWIDYVKILDPVFNSNFSTQNGGEYVGVGYNEKVHYDELYNFRWKPYGAQNRYATDD